jgi:hypothetical protein
MAIRKAHTLERAGYLGGGQAMVQIFDRPTL